MNIKIEKETWHPVYVPSFGGGEIEVNDAKAKEWAAAGIAFNQAQREMAAESIRVAENWLKKEINVRNLAVGRSVLRDAIPFEARRWIETGEPS